MPRKEWVAEKDIECSLVTFLFELIVIFMGCDFQFLKILASIRIREKDKQEGVPRVGRPVPEKDMQVI